MTDRQTNKHTDRHGDRNTHAHLLRGQSNEVNHFEPRRTLNPSVNSHVHRRGSENGPDGQSLRKMDDRRRLSPGCLHAVNVRQIPGFSVCRRTTVLSNESMRAGSRQTSARNKAERGSLMSVSIMSIYTRQIRVFEKWRYPRNPPRSFYFKTLKRRVLLQSKLYNSPVSVVLYVHGRDDNSR